VECRQLVLMGRGRSDGAIQPCRRAFDFCKECKGNRSEIGQLPAGSVLTSGGRLTAKYVIHTVGPIYGRGGGEAERA